MPKPSTINQSLINSLKTRAYLDLNALKNTSDLQLITPHCYLEETSKDFLLHEAKYNLDHNLEDVWNAYIDIPPAEAWTGKRIAFSFCFDRNEESLTYLNDDYDGLKENQLIFIEIKVAFGLVKIAVTHEVNQVDPVEKKCKFCYVEGGKAKGSQMIKFVATGPNSTMVVHDTYYKSESKFRDIVLYPFVHGRIIDEFHANVKRYLEKSKNTAEVVS